MVDSQITARDITCVVMHLQGLSYETKSGRNKVTGTLLPCWLCPYLGKCIPKRLDEFVYMDKVFRLQTDVTICAEHHIKSYLYNSLMRRTMRREDACEDCEKKWCNHAICMNKTLAPLFKLYNKIYCLEDGCLSKEDIWKLR